MSVTESVVEEATLSWFADLGYPIKYGMEDQPGEMFAERPSYDTAILPARLRSSLSQINPNIPSDAIDDAVRKISGAALDSPSLFENNKKFHKLLTDGVEVEYRRADGSIAGDTVWILDFADPNQNDWLVMNQFTVVEGKENRRPDLVVFLNGLPLAVIELKNAADENATLKKAFNQLQTYKKKISALFPYNALLIISDGLEARIGSLTADWERFAPWRTIDGVVIAPKGMPEMETMIRGIFHKERLLDLIRNFIVFEVDGPTIVKKIAGYHQFHAVNKAVESTLAAVKGDGRAGVIWHTQGSGKSLSMAFYAGKIIKHPLMENPTLVVLTDRNDLDEQLHTTFSSCADLLRQSPVKVENREELQTQLKVASGGVVFTTIQKFLPEERAAKFPTLTERRNVVVIADEAHRSQYGLDAKLVQDKDKGEAYITYGFAKYLRDALPHASFIGFTGTPIERVDVSTKAIFGEYIDTYDIQRAVEDGATVRIYYEARMAKLELKNDERPKLDPDFEEVTEGAEEIVKEKLKTKWASLEAMVGSDKRIDLIAQDIVEHFENRLEVMDGKGMIVCMSRRICVDLYDALVLLRPDWHHEDDGKGSLKVVMTSSASDPEAFHLHMRNKKQREELAKRFKRPADQFKLVIVRDMWLTGFDAPCLHTMYVDKPMRGHGLMQTISRVNRVFKDKPGGLIVDYLGIADQLKKALSEYTVGDRGETGIPIEQAVEILLEKHEIIADMYHGFDYDAFFSGTPAQRLSVLPAAQEHILSLDDGKSRYLKAVTELSRAFALSMPHEAAVAIREDVVFFQSVRAALVKTTGGDGGGKGEDDFGAAIRQIVSKAVTSAGVIDIYSAAGLKTPDISILSDEFLAEVRGMPHRNLALELLRKLINDEIKGHFKKNVVKARSFADLLEKTIRAYHNRSIEAVKIIEELIALAKTMREAYERGESLGMSDDELAFYDALEVNDSAVNVLGDDALKHIAKELVEMVRRNVTIDWTAKEGVRARLRTLVKRILRKYGYPPDKQEKATQTVLEQAEQLCTDWAA